MNAFDTGQREALRVVTYNILSAEILAVFFFLIGFGLNRQNNQNIEKARFFGKEKDTLI